MRPRFFYYLTLTFLTLAAKVPAIVPWSLFINTNNVVVVTNAAYGAVGDGVFTNTTAIQNAINTATAGAITNGLIGGTVEIPPGIFLCGPISLKNNVNLQIDSGAILRMLPFNKYPGGIVSPANFISGSSLTNIEISGSGAVDGQGSPWWHSLDTNSATVRPIMVRLSSCNRQLIQNVTLSNSPEFHLSFSGSKGNITVQGVTIVAPSSSASPQPSHNTDACDVSGTNVLVQNCNISVGDDDFTCGGGTHDVLITNNVYGNGHGISIGSYTDSGGVSNITVINCTISGADNGIRIKSDNDRGGLVQNISYLNIGITNVHFPIQIYGYYNWYGTPSGISPQIAASTNPAAVSFSSGGGTPIFRNITFSNITATSVSGYPIGIIWARTEMPATNIVFNKVNIAGDRSFDLYNVGAQFTDCSLKVSATSNTFTLFNARVVITNSVPTNSIFTFNGLTTNGYGCGLSVSNVQFALPGTTLAGGIFTVSNSLTLFSSNVLNFPLGTNAAKVAVLGNLTLGGTNKFFAGSGFSDGTYTLMTYTGTLGDPMPVIGLTPTNLTCAYAFDTNTTGQIKLIVTLLPPTNLVATATNLQINLKWNAANGVTNYNLKRGTSNGGPYPTIFSGLTTTNYADVNVTNAVNYFYVVTAIASGESTNSLQANAIPLPSNQPADISAQVVSGELQLSWPQDHLGWRLQIQTNDLTGGLSANWATVPNSTNVMATNIFINPLNGSVFLRLVYP